MWSQNTGIKVCHNDSKLNNMMIKNPCITVANIVKQELLARYPRPYLITLDRGSEFISQDFHDMCVNDYGIKKKNHFHAKSLHRQMP